MKFGLTNKKPIYIPMLPGETLSHDQLLSMPTETQEMSKIPYGNMIGHMLWPVMISHPDAIFATAILSQFIKPWPHSRKGIKTPDFVLIHHMKLLAHVWW